MVGPVRRPGRVILLVALLAMSAAGPGLAGGSHPVAAEEACQVGDAGTGAQGKPGLDALRRLPLRPDEPAIAIATHDGSPTLETARGLAALGLVAQPLAHLPMTILLGQRDLLLAAADVVGVDDVYPDRRLQWLSRKSTAAIGADTVWADHGYTGRGVGIAIVDSGLDATHPAFEGRVKRNVKIIGPEYLDAFGLPRAGLPGDSLVLAADEGPYSNTDPVGHGTLVAGIAAAADVGGEDEVDGPVGVAPGADLVGYAVGEPFVFTVLAAFDDILDRREELNIRVVNNSWGDRFRTFDPDEPVNRATKALHDAGMVVTFAAGNGTEEMTLNSLGVAPWVVSVGSATTGGASAATSSAGLRYDNSVQAHRGAHRRFLGDGPGLYHPHVSAPGESIISTASLTRGTESGSGTSMASPHAAGLAAILFEANPALTPDQVKQVLQVTAAPAAGWTLWKTGFGFIDAPRAVDLALTENLGERLDALHETRTTALLSRRDHRVEVSDHWSFEAAYPVTGLGVERRCFPFEVAAADGIGLVRAAAGFAGTLDGIQEGVRNEFGWTMELRDAAGKVVATSSTRMRNGVSTLEADLGTVPGGVTFGTWQLEIAADLALTQPPPVYTPDVSLVVSQLVPQAPDLPVGNDAVELPLAAASDGLPVSSVEGCAYEQPPTTGRLGGSGSQGCRAALVGFTTSTAGGVAEFVSEPLSEPLELGGTGLLALHLADEAHSAWGAAPVTSRVYYDIEVLGPGGAVSTLAKDQPPTQISARPVRGEYAFVLAPQHVPAGSRLRLGIEVSGAHASGVRLLYGGGYDSALTLPISTTAP